MSLDSVNESSFCPYFEKMGCCPFGDSCKQKHILKTIPRCVIFHHLYPDPDLFIESLPPGTLTIQKNEKQRLVDAFFLDICTMVKNFGVVEDVALASNRSDHLNGNVWVWFKETDSAVMCKTALDGQYYAGRKIRVTLCCSPRLSISICKHYAAGECPNGNTCLYLHTLEPSFNVFNECIPRSAKAYPDKFRKYRTIKAIDTPDDLISGKCKATLPNGTKLPLHFPETNVYEDI